MKVEKSIYVVSICDITMHSTESFVDPYGDPPGHRSHITKWFLPPPSSGGNHRKYFG